MQRSIILPMEDTMNQLKCKRCGYEWFKSRPEMPKVCPRCKSYKWNGEYTKPKGATQ